MKYKLLLLTLFLGFGYTSIKAQEHVQLSLEQAVHCALTQSDDAKITEAKLLSAKSELASVKSNQYPDFKLSGQMDYLTTAQINSNISLGSQSSDNSAPPVINHLFLGQATVSMPLFSGFKLKNIVSAGEDNYKAATYQSQNEKEQIEIQTIENYISIYKANQIIKLIAGHLKQSERRVKDFKGMEQNGLLAKNDLLKAKLQKANISLSLAQAKKNATMLNYKLAVLLQYPDSTVFDIDANSFKIGLDVVPSDTVNSRADLEALRFQTKAAKSNIGVAKSKLYPSVAFVGGYTALNLGNAISVYNAMNFGIGISYNLSDIFKSKSHIAKAKSQADAMQYTLNKAANQVKIQIENALQNYQLALTSYKVYQESLAQASENFRIVQDKFKNGLADTNDLLEADVQQLQSEIDLANGQANVAQDYYNLWLAKGLLTKKINK